MIPQRLTLRNFLSYQEATLDFKGFQVACISGPNGAGKSSLLEAITWAIWGQSRAATEDDVIYLGEMETQVQYVFEHQEQVYRVLRSRRRNHGGTLDLQVQTEDGFRTLTQRGMRATQQLISRILRLDYDTFVNSAYLRQGRADEFMLKRPSERKQILADLLKLGQYDQLVEQAKERARDAKAQVAVLETTLAGMQEQVDQRSAIAQQAKFIEAKLATFQADQKVDQQALETLLQHQQERQQLLQVQALLQQQLAHLTVDHDRLQAEQTQLQASWEAVQAVVDQADVIESGLQSLRVLEAAEEDLSIKFKRQQALRMQRDVLDKAHQEQMRSLEQQQQQQQLQLTNLDQQIDDLVPLLAKQETTSQAAAELAKARDRLKAMDRLQLQISPLRQRQQALQRQLDQTQAELAAKLNVLGNSEMQLQRQQAQHPHLQQAVLEVGYTLAELTEKRTYQEKVREKGVERRHFMERLQAEQRNCEVQLAHIEQKLQMLKQPDALCPVCDRLLEQHNWDSVLAKHGEEREELLRQIWVIREQLAVSEREIQVLRQEYRELDESLTDYGRILERRGQLMAQLNNTESAAQQLQAVEQERSHLENCLTEKKFAREIRTELNQIADQIQRFAYDERDHALVKGQVDRLRWSEIRQADIQQAKRKHKDLTAQRPNLIEQIAIVEAAIAAANRSEAVTQIADIDAQVDTLGYDLEQHQQIRAQIRAAQNWTLQYQTLEKARQKQPQLSQQQQVLTQQQQQISQQRQHLTEQAQTAAQQLNQHPDPQLHIEAVQDRLRDRQQQREQMLSSAGALQQQLAYLDHLQNQYENNQQALQQHQHSLRIHQELAQAFGRNGLQALLIEHVLPQLEAETNRILGRLSNHQFHVQFVTQRAGRGRQGKLIDTLEIVIADAQGTRPYETYSGGEAFRVNFAIRLALAQLLAQRAGTPLQMLIIDEGFGTQDRDGCDRLVGAINAITSDFASILAVTHVPHFREAFQTRIDVTKTPTGSQIVVR